MNRQSSYILFLTIILAVGCDAGRGEFQESLGLSGNTFELPATPIISFHDFGYVLGVGKTLEHSFVLRNDSDSPLHSLRTVALTPCCSRIELQSESIPPGGGIVARTFLKLGQQSEKKFVEFSIYSESHDSPRWRLQLRAETLVDREVIPVEPPDKFLRLASSSNQQRWVWRVLTRHGNDVPPIIPVQVEATEPVLATFEAESSERTLPGDIHEIARDIVVMIPDTKKAGYTRSALKIGLSDGSSIQKELSWEVTPSLQVSPSGFVLHRQKGRVAQTIILRSDDKPFIIREIRNPLSGVGETANLDARLSERSNVHSIVLDLDPSMVEAGTTSSIRIKTDHPEEPEVRVSLLVLDMNSGEK